MKMLSRVCADFTDSKGNVIYRITPADRLVYKEDVPEAIREDLLFKLLLADGSIEVVETVEQRKKIEQDPTAGTLADGRKASKVKPEAKTEEKPAEEKPAGAEKK